MALLRLLVPMLTAGALLTPHPALAAPVAVPFPGGEGAVRVASLAYGPHGQVEVRRTVAASPSEGRAVAARLKQTPGVLDAEVETRVTASWLPAPDPRQPEQWGLEATRATQAWQSGPATDQLVAVIDSGADLGHADLRPNVVAGWDFVRGDSVPEDENGHGTHVAGIIGAVAGNGTGGAGAALGARVLVIKVLGPDGSGRSGDVAAAIRYAADKGADVINLSLGSPTLSTMVSNAVAEVLGRGVVVVAAAGNEGTSAPNYPAALDGVIAVAAVDASGVRAAFSSTGAHLDLSAPGVGVLSTVPGGAYSSMSGTSMATPFVAAAAALLRAGEPGLSPAHVGQRLAATARDLGPAGRDDLYGAGIVDVSTARRVHVDAFVRALHRDFLFRDATGAELDRYSASVVSGARSRMQVAQELARTDEWIGKLVTGFYLSALGREPDPVGLADWTQQLRSGVPVAQVAASFYASEEYFVRRGSQVEPWVTDLYRELLQREPDPQGLQHWSRTAREAGRLAVALPFYQSPETLERRVQTLYESLLGRSADPAGLGTWPPVVRDQGDLSLSAFLASSEEYFSRAQGR